MTEMQDIFQYYYKYWDQMHHVVRADLIYAETPSKEEEAEAKKILDKNYPDSEITLNNGDNICCTNSAQRGHLPVSFLCN